MDYKSVQYKFAGATDADKSKLIKDCLAFANSWRQERGHILIGVKESAGHPADVCGIPREAHFDDADLQQLLNSKTNVPIRFLYETVEFRGVSVGVLRFECTQERPVYLRRDFGGLMKEEVYIRRGSSTDVCRPEEIARMGAQLHPAKRLELALAFVDGKSEETIGQCATVRPIMLVEPAHWKEEPTTDAGLGAAIDFIALQSVLRFAKFWLMISNRGTGTAEDIAVDIMIRSDGRVELADETDPPYQKYEDDGAFPEVMSRVPRINPDSAVKQRSNKWIISLHCDQLHAGQSYMFEPLYVAGTDAASLVHLDATLYARDLPES